MKSYIALDIGGTSISAAIVSEAGYFITDVIDYEANSNSGYSEILDNFSSVINEQYKIGTDLKLNICGAGIAFPGPFDYENGISLMRGIGKYDNIYGMNLKDELLKRLPDGTDIKFYNDADLYTIGECTFGVGKEYNRCMCVCIGTGIGSGFFADGKLVRFGIGIPKDGWIYDTPYRDGIADEYLSGTGIKKLMANDPNLREYKNVKELSIAAQGGNPYAIKIFNVFGDMLCDVLIPFAVNFRAQCLILGGNVSRGSDLFDKQLRHKLSFHNIKVIQSLNFANNTLLACSQLFN